MTQDLLFTVIPRMEARFKDMFYISNELGQILLTDEGAALKLPVAQNDFKLKYKFSTIEEWRNELLQMNQRDANARYPFLWVNAEGVTQSPTIDSITTIPNIMLAVNSNPKWTTAERDLWSFNPLLSNLYNIFIEACKQSTYFSLVDQGERMDFYGNQKVEGLEGYVFHDYVDAIKISNIKIRIYKYN